MSNSFHQKDIERGCEMEVAMIGSYAFHVRLGPRRKVFKVHTDAVEWMYGETLDSTFAHCDCARGKRETNRNGSCEHIAAVYMALAQEAEDCDDDPEPTD